MGEAGITKPQLKRLQTLAGQLCLRDGVPRGDWRTYRLAWVARRLNLPDLASFSDLYKDQAIAILDLLGRELPGQPRRPRSGSAAGTAGRRNRKGDPAVIVSQGSLELLGSLRARLGWNDQRFEAFTRRQLRGRSAIRTEADANRVIWPLKRILRSQGASTKNPTPPLGDTGAVAMQAGAAAPEILCGTGALAGGLSSSEAAQPGAAVPHMQACSGCPGPLEDESDRPILIFVAPPFRAARPREMPV